MSATDTYGLVNMGGRQYDARIGVFTTADPFVTVKCPHTMVQPK